MMFCRPKPMPNAKRAGEDRELRHVHADGGDGGEEAEEQDDVMENGGDRVGRAAREWKRS